MSKTKIINNFNSITGTRERSPKAIPNNKMAMVKRANSNKGKDRYYHRVAVEGKQEEPQYVNDDVEEEFEEDEYDDQSIHPINMQFPPQI